MNFRLLGLLLFFAVCAAYAQAADPMDEFIELRRTHATEALPVEDLLRLANLYLVQGLYAKSAEFYAELIQEIEQSALPEDRRTRILAQSHYNRGLALFTIGLYESGKVNFQRAFYYNPSNGEALRMLGSTAFAQKNKEDAVTNWNAYLAQAPEGPVKEAVRNALDRLLSPEFSFEPPQAPQEEPRSDTLWPFRNFETIPYPDALYEKKRVI